MRSCSREYSSGGLRTARLADALNLTFQDKVEKDTSTWRPTRPNGRPRKKSFRTFSL